MKKRGLFIWTGILLFCLLAFLVGRPIFHNTEQSTGEDSRAERTSSSERTKPGRIRPGRTRPRQEIIGFDFNNYYMGKKNLSIKADRFSIRKKKIGVFSFGLLNNVVLENGAIDIYDLRKQTKSFRTTQPAFSDTGAKAEGETAGVSQPFNEIFSKKFLPPIPIRRVSGITIEPVSMNLHDENEVTTSITAASADILLSRREIVFKGNVRLHSAGRTLTAGRLRLQPKTGRILASRNFTLHTPERSMRGNKLVTDISLKSFEF